MKKEGEFMKKKEILSKLAELELDVNDYLIISGASLVCHGVIRETSDIDLSCSGSWRHFGVGFSGPSGC